MFNPGIHPPKGFSSGMAQTGPSNCVCDASNSEGPQHGAPLVISSIQCSFPVPAIGGWDAWLTSGADETTPSVPATQVDWDEIFNPFFLDFSPSRPQSGKEGRIEEGPAGEPAAAAGGASHRAPEVLPPSLSPRDCPSVGSEPEPSPKGPRAGVLRDMVAAVSCSYVEEQDAMAAYLQNPESGSVTPTNLSETQGDGLGG
jgi:hypothetical protein